ncbi:MAG TPA: permease-like cell division protein FtsX [Candidatus Binatia bacterium]|nr:permease-like cell division protein FtsX [Candidatus Binatia bacterium]
MEYYFRRALDGIKASPAASGVAMASIAASVLFAGAVLLVSSNAYRMVARWAASGIDVSIYFTEQAAESDIVATKTRIGEDPAVIEARYISPDEGWQFLADNLDRSAELLAGLEPSVLPASLEIKLERALSDEELAARIQQWRALPGVSDVQSTRSIASGGSALDIVRWVAWALGALTLLVSVIIVATTFQLAAYTRRDEMNVLRLVGAVGPGYWGPVVLAGILEGILGALVALGVLAAVFQGVSLPIEGELPALTDVLSFLSARQCLTLTLWGAALGGAGSAVGMWRVSQWR